MDAVAPGLIIQQAASEVLMISPSAFRFNPETAASNHFQEDAPVKDQAVFELEFNNLADVLRSNGIRLHVLTDNGDPDTPDSIFPNNWFSVHREGLVLYPMQAANRRLERLKFIAQLRSLTGNRAETDMSPFESEGLFLEGTGSLVLDRINRVAYAAVSPRTSPRLVNHWCEQMGYEPVLFEAVDLSGKVVYHTNVLMSIGPNLAIVCLDAIRSADQRTLITETISRKGFDLLPITLKQVHQFAGNMLCLRNTSNELFWVMSSAAYHALDREQINRLGMVGKVLHSPLDHIEKLGGGSARCMMAELDLP